MADFSFHATGTKAEIFSQVQAHLDQLKFKVVAKDTERPWGGFFVIDESQAGAFADHFFPGIGLQTLRIAGKLSPKILLVQPGKRLSWQYHFRRAEIWKLAGGVAGVVTSMTDEEGPVHRLAMGEVVRLAQGQRHRLVGLEGGWGMIAEIWQHVDAAQPSDESDIVRLQDDFGR